MGERPQPLYSAHAEDPAMTDAIDRFVLALAEAVDALQDAYIASDCTRLDRLARDLATDAEFLGYGPLAQLAEDVASCAVREKQEEARVVLEDLTGIAQRIRMGHRGAI
jgi:hypothetical protein